ncbi:MAG: hypothetical protein CL844_05240 [Crocinitomicaceae bacterium]|nr:hypothetical protein [Crocinitomicaceae bacterium]
MYLSKTRNSIYNTIIKEMKKITSILFGITLTISFGINAQNKEQGEKENAEITANKIANEIAECLHLSDAQKERVKIIELGIIEKKEGIKNSAEYSQEEKEKYFIRINRRRIEMINSILDPKQKELDCNLK